MNEELLIQCGKDVNDKYHNREILIFIRGYVLIFYVPPLIISGIIFVFMFMWHLLAQVLEAIVNGIFNDGVFDYDWEEFWGYFAFLNNFTEFFILIGYITILVLFMWTISYGIIRYKQVQIDTMCRFSKVLDT